MDGARGPGGYRQMKMGSGTARQNRDAKFQIPDSRRDLRRITTIHELVLQRSTAATQCRFFASLRMTGHAANMPSC